MYDVFLSYSSEDTVQADRVQRFLERYKHPRGAVGTSRLRIKVFRDKTDQGLTPDFRAAFEKQIKNSPSFLLLGSETARISPHVIKECEYFIETGRDSINLALIGESAQRAFPDIVLERFPHAIHADARMTKTTNAFRWWMIDRRHFRDEMLRIASSILQRKSGIYLSYDALRQREKHRRVLRITLWFLAAIAFSIALAGYYATTDAYGVQLTKLGRSKVEKVLPAFKGDGELELIAVTETRRFWSDDDGHEGFDVDVAIHGLDHRGRLLGKLDFTLDEVREMTGEPDRSGVFTPMSSDEISQLLVRLEYKESDLTNKSITDPIDAKFSWKRDCAVHQADQTLTHQFDARRAFQVCGNDHTPPSVSYHTEDAGRTWARTAEFPFHLKNASVWYVSEPTGLAFVGTPEEVDPYYLSPSGLFMTTDFGKNWAPVPEAYGDWNSLKLVAANPHRPTHIAVAMGAPMRSGDLEAAGLWFTRNGGVTWESMGFRGTDVDVASLYVMDSGDVVAVVNGQLVLYRQRSVIDRLLQRFDLPTR